MNTPLTRSSAAFASFLLGLSLGLSLVPCGQACMGGEPKGPLIGFADSRTWADSTGRFKIEAKLVSADPSEITLLKSDGKQVTIPLTKMSKTDQTFVNSFLTAEKAIQGVGGPSADEADDNPFAGGEAAAGMDADSGFAGGSLADSSGASSGPPSGTLIDRKSFVKGFRPLSITPARAFWSVGQLRGFPEVSFEESVLTVPLPKPFFAGMRLMAEGKSGTVVANSYRESRGNDESYGKFVIANLSTGQSSDVNEFSDPWKLMNVSPDGGRAVAVRVEGFDKGNDLAIFRIENTRLIPEFRFTAGGGSWDELHYAAFLTKNRMVTISQKHNLTVWDLGNKLGPKALLQGPSGGTLTATLSPATDMMAMMIGNSIAMVDTDEFKLVGCINRDEVPRDIAFSADAKSLAIFHPFNIDIIDLSSGQVSKSFAVAEGSQKEKVRWVGKNVLIGDVLYDAEKGFPMWTYQARSSDTATLGSYMVSAFGQDNQSVLTTFKLPHDQAVRAAANVDPKKIYSIIPGDTVSVLYDCNGASPTVTLAIRKAVEEKIAALGWKVAASSPNQMLVTLQQGKQAEVEYYTRRGFGPGPSFAPPGFGGPPSGPSEKVQYTPWTHSVRIEAAGVETFASTVIRGAPQNLSTNEGESTQAAVTRLSQPDPNYFKGLALAPHLLKKEYQGGLGKSTISDKGMN